MTEIERLRAWVRLSDKAGLRTEHVRDVDKVLDSLNTAHQDLFGLADILTGVRVALDLPLSTHINELPAAVTKALKEAYDKGYEAALPHDAALEEWKDDITTMESEEELKDIFNAGKERDTDE